MNSIRARLNFSGRVLLLVSVFLVGFCAGWFIKLHWFADITSPGRPIRQGQYGLINPLLSYTIPNQSPELNPLQNKIQNVISQAIQMNKIQSVAFYFRDFITDHWTGINPDEKFYPASLLKVPLMEAYLQKTEDDPTLLDRKLTFLGTDSVDVREDIVPSHTLVVGESYRISDLINRMIVYSDNNAAGLLAKNINNTDLNQVYTDLSLTSPPATTTQDFMSPRQYSLFFRVLFSSSYLPRSLSQMALEILSKAEFSQGLLAGVPADLTVAHKFGEYNPLPSAGIVLKQMHDCGIIYYPKHPYFLCVMTRGYAFEDMEATIAQISDAVYNEASNSLYR